MLQTFGLIPIKAKAARFTSFSHAIPQDPLGLACISVMEKEGEPGRCLKLLRLLSMQLNITMLKAIRGFSLIIDGKQLPDLNMLRLSHLQRLKAQVVSGEGVQWSHTLKRICEGVVWKSSKHKQIFCSHTAQHDILLIKCMQRHVIETNKPT